MSDLKEILILIHKSFYRMLQNGEKDKILNYEFKVNIYFDIYSLRYALSKCDIPTFEWFLKDYCPDFNYKKVVNFDYFQELNNSSDCTYDTGHKLLLLYNICKINVLEFFINIVKNEILRKSLLKQLKYFEQDKLFLGNLHQ
jgi:hypothetical protein